MKVISLTDFKEKPRKFDNFFIDWNRAAGKWEVLRFGVVTIAMVDTLKQAKQTVASLQRQDAINQLAR